MRWLWHGQQSLTTEYLEPARETPGGNQNLKPQTLKVHPQPHTLWPFEGGEQFIESKAGRSCLYVTVTVRFTSVSSFFDEGVSQNQGPQPFQIIL